MNIYSFLLNMLLDFIIYKIKEYFYSFLIFCYETWYLIGLYRLFTEKRLFRGNKFIQVTLYLITALFRIIIKVR